MKTTDIHCGDDPHDIFRTSYRSIGNSTAPECETVINVIDVKSFVKPFASAIKGITDPRCFLIRRNKNKEVSRWFKHRSSEIAWSPNNQIGEVMFDGFELPSSEQANAIQLLPRKAWDIQSLNRVAAKMKKYVSSVQYSKFVDMMELEKIYILDRCADCLEFNKQVDNVVATSTRLRRNEVQKRVEVWKTHLKNDLCIESSVDCERFPDLWKFPEAQISDAGSTSSDDALTLKCPIAQT